MADCRLAVLRPPPRGRWHAYRRPRVWQELLFIGLAYELYSLVRNGVPTRESTAFVHAGRVLRLEGVLHLRVEQPVNATVAAVHWLSLTADYWYATMHFIVTISVLVWLWRTHPFRYRAARSVLMFTNLIALGAFWAFPLAPPRMLDWDGFIDTVSRDHIWGSMASGGIAAASNQFAAMPSMHIGWSLWCGIVIVTLARRRWVRVLGALYPIVTLTVIIGTANHYVLDAVGGVVALALGFAGQRVLSGRPALAPPVVTPVPAVPEPAVLEDAA